MTVPTLPGYQCYRPLLPGLRVMQRPCLARCVGGAARAWTRAPCVPVVAAGSGSTPTNSFKVLTYNILAEKYTLGSWHTYCPAQHLAWSSRLRRLRDELSMYDSDIVCLQEVETGAYSSQLQPWMAQRGFQGHYLARQFGDNVQGPPEGVALFYRSSMFELVTSSTVTFSKVATAPQVVPSALSSSDEPPATAPARATAASEPAVGSSSGGSSSSSSASARQQSNSQASTSRQQAGSVSDSDSDGGSGGGGSNEFWKVFKRRQEGAILALLRHRSSGRLLLAACTHLFWNPAYPDVKAYQAAVLCQATAAFMSQHCGGPNKVPVVLGGDFNSMARKYLPDTFDPKIASPPLVSGVYTLLSEGQLAAAHPDHPATRRRPGETANRNFRGITLDSAGLELASMHMMAHGREPPLTSKTTTFGGCLDYIWVSPRHLRVTDTLGLPYDEPSDWRDPLKDVPFPAIPSADFPSDHLAMGCVVEFK